jgi:hypothetical protein
MVDGRCDDNPEFTESGSKTRTERNRVRFPAILFRASFVPDRGAHG